jgi:hypothetical protein
MLKRIKQKVVTSLRNLIREELNREHQDLAVELQRQATTSSAQYIAANMRGVDSVTTNLDLLSLAAAAADFTNAPLVCELGVYSGLTINHLAKVTGRPVYGFDSFQGLPERWRDGYPVGQFARDGMPVVEPNVNLIKGWFEDSLPLFCAKHAGNIGLLHVDCDLYSSTKTVFKVLEPRLVPGTVIVFDEYLNYPGWEQGEFLAFREFLASSGLTYTYLGYNRRHEQVAVKLASSLK